MSALIKGMKMPTKGEYELRLFCHSDGTATLEGFSIEFEGEPFEVIEVPTPHGRLIDADELIVFEAHVDGAQNGLRFVPAEFIEAAPTIIEAEEDSHE